jgi:hypothetical protein
MAAMLPAFVLLPNGTIARLRHGSTHVRSGMKRPVPPLKAAGGRDNNARLQLVSVQQVMRKPAVSRQEKSFKNVTYNLNRFAALRACSPLVGFAGDDSSGMPLGGSDNILHSSQFWNMSRI